MQYVRLGDLLISSGYITKEQLNKALEEQKKTGKRLGTCLVEMGIITQRQMIRALELQLGLDLVDLSKTAIPPEVIQYVPKALAKKHGVVPVRVENDKLYLAMSDPLNYVAIEDVKAASHKHVVPMISTQEAVERAIMILYGNEGAARAIEEMRRGSGVAAQADVVFNSATLEEDDTQSAPTVRLVNSIVERAVTERASDIHLEPREDEMVVRMRIDGVLHPVLTIPRELQTAVISRLKIMASMDIAERKVPQDGRTNVRVKQRNIDLRVSTLPTIYGEKMVIRLLDKNNQLQQPEDVGLDGENRVKYDRLMQNASGVILIAGPTGSGKSSTMYIMLRQLNKNEVNLLTLEDPVEYDMSGVNQVQVNEKTGMTFANGLRACLRQDPDIIGVGEIRDGETAEIAMRAAITGHLVLSTIHTNDALSTIDRLRDIGVAPYLISSALKGVISQRLVRRICPSCREAYVPTPQQRQTLNLPEDDGLRFYRGKGCPMCFDTGYRGRIAAFEILIIDKQLRELVSHHGERAELEAYVQSTGFESMCENCARLVRDGVTTYEEAIRTVMSTE